jgi:YesN/AraC family two-component response regulator
MDQDHSENGNVTTGEYVQIVVKDTGKGIPESKREKIFERFYQGKTDGDQINTGSGIGLSLSRELVKIHHGLISLKSQEGVGTEFTILLPVIKEDPDRQEKNEVQAFNEFQQESLTEEETQLTENQIDSGKPILLVLEDNRELLDFIISIFTEDYHVIFAEDGEAGLNLATETIPDIIISDILMPKMDGKKICKAIKADFKTSHIPVILLTALSSKHHEKEGILVGADDYIVKPFDPSLLKIRVDQLLSTRRLLREKYNRENILHPAEKSVSSPDDKFLQKLVGIIENNIADPTFGTIKISREIGVSRTQLYRKMAALTEMTVKEFIRSVRLKRACQLILQEEMNISEVAYSVGFQQVAYFRKCFKEVYKMTPSDYIKKNSKLIAENGKK